MRFDSPLSFVPLYQERVWGGRDLAQKLGRSLPLAGPIGESWDLVDREEAQSVVENGPWQGVTLHTLWTRHREAVFGRGLRDSPRFPLLFKILDARELLSVQVHPPAALAAGFGGEPKTEAWYLMDAREQACVYAGFRQGVTREGVQQALKRGEIEPLLHRISVQKGDAIFIPSGRCHAIGAGCLIAEIQQNSDTTYRVFDWNRLGTDGQPRALHLQESLACMDFEDYEPEKAPASGERLVTCPFFALERWDLENSRPHPGGEMSFFLVLEGSLECGGRCFERGNTFLLPSEASGLVLTPTAPGTAVLRGTLPESVSGIP
ncbi:MAG: hypothetical protein RLZZ399_1098 [Verrucomicrobiota bacterium]|jgi:mannose-6-phosphate isomerase